MENRSNIGNGFYRFIQSVTLMAIYAVFIIYLLFISANVYSDLFSYHGKDFRTLGFLGFFIVYSAILFFVIPALIGKFVYKENLNELGLKLPENIKKTLLLMLLAEIILIPCIIYIGKEPSVEKYYSFIKQSSISFLLIQFVVYIIYYFCEEFFFRGFLFLRMWKKVGWHAFWIVDLLFVFCHLFKPGWEIALSLPAGIIFAVLALQTRSIFPSMIVHYSMGIVMALVQLGVIA